MCVEHTAYYNQSARHLTQVKRIPNQVITTRISIDIARSMTVTSNNCRILVPKIDIDGLIQYLQEVKVFLSENDLCEKLVGKA